MNFFKYNTQSERNFLDLKLKNTFSKTKTKEVISHMNIQSVETHYSFDARDNKKKLTKIPNFPFFFFSSSMLIKMEEKT
jgi:hypothetical protein